MNEITRILMERDGLTEIEAMNFYEESEMEIQDCIANGDYMGAYDVMQYNFGLEPDYFDFMF